MQPQFLANRLARMSLPEIAYRVKKKTIENMEKIGAGFYKYDITASDRKCHFLFRQVEFGNVLRLFRKADNLCKNRMDIFTLKDVDIGERINYHTDYKSGLSAPAGKYGKSINYRDAQKIGDIKYIWEVNRHLFLVTLSLAFKISGVRSYYEKFKYYLCEWFEQNPFPLGVNWSSPLELGIRLINWTFCWHLLKGTIEPELERKWLESVYQHCLFINRNFSAYSSANNHLIGEASGLFTACVALPGFDMTSRWRESAYGILLQECVKQNHCDGVNKEQAVSYQQFVLDFLIIAGLAGKANNCLFPEEYWSVVEKMLEYLAAIEDASGNIPKFGDEDDGLVVDIGQKDYGICRSLFNTGAYIFDRADFLRNIKDPDDRTELLLNIGGYDTLRLPRGCKPVPNRFDAGGYYILGSNFNRPDEQKLIFDCGPLGYLSLAAHGHADALSFCFSAGGCPVFVDPGTFAYHTEKKWRNYFRSTCAHNTACIDGKDQSVNAGSFMWARKANSQLIQYEDFMKVKGTHDGYMRLKKGVRHTREICFKKDDNCWIISDEFECRSEHCVALYFHLHPQCVPVLHNDTADIIFDKGVCRLYFQKDLHAEIRKGEEEPPIGWYSGSYDSRTAANTIRLYKKIRGSEKIVTGFEILFKEN